MSSILHFEGYNSHVAIAHLMRILSPHACMGRNYHTLHGRWDIAHVMTIVLHSEYHACGRVVLYRGCNQAGVLKETEQLRMAMT
ncbi:hypothetical protein SCLCIDRAFT_984804 [Scleroderma citrinum Foug A]|uniref:Uncharacterized protein n=1 Tax=Scleroderma citrinum Foug A TaxID=1036808 RepID=A0A0C3DG87_9AGAM|nr:hypothetical protein SCLCIDRAFT_984804 [Scleroderma citrinum Foug A]